jgi:putative addiction module killer protein
VIFLKLGYPVVRHKKVLSKYERVEFYRTESGRVPFEKWYKKLDPKNRARVYRRLERLEYYGEFGSYRTLPGPHHLMELKFHRGAGYRIYGALGGGMFIVLLAGSKSSQKQDIKLARQYVKDFWRNRYGFEGEE